MQTIDAYLDRARSAAGIPSDGQLAAALGLTRAQVSYYRQRKTWPSPSTMLRIAELGQMDPTIALMELEVWREQDTKAREVYSRILAKLTATAATAALLAGIVGAPSPAAATEREQISGRNANTMHYATKALRKMNMLNGLASSAPPAERSA